MSRFTSTADLNIRLPGGFEVVGVAGTTHRVPDALATEVERDYAPRIPGFAWVVQDEATVSRFMGSPWHDVSAYGAVGDGVTNDYAAIAAAIAAAAGGGVIAFPAGTYAIGTRISLSSDVSLAGAGEGVTTLLPLAGIATAAMIGLSASSASGVSVSNMTIDLSGSTVKGIQITNGSRVSIDRVRFVNCPGIGIHLSATPDSRITNCRVEATGADAIRLDGGSNRCQIVGNFISFSAGKGVNLLSTGGGNTDCIIARNDISVSGDGAGSQEMVGVAWGSDRTIVLGNIARGSASHEDTGFSISGNECVVASNHVSGSGLHGITVGDGTNSITAGVVTGNVSKNNHQLAGGAARAGFSIQGTTGGVVFEGNIAYDDQSSKTQDYGLSLSTVADIRIGRANHLSGNLTGEIKYSAVSQSPIDTQGAGTPEGAVVAGVGSTFRRIDGGTGSTLYVKESGTGNTGWVAK